MDNQKSEIDQAVLDELVRRIREVVEPIRIILFGSAARGEIGPDSDIDVLVVVPEGSDTHKLSGSIYRNLIGYGMAVDVILVTEENLEQYQDRPGLIYRPALREGRDLYAA